MVSVASGVLDVNHTMLQLMMLSRELCHQSAMLEPTSLSRSDGK